MKRVDKKSAHARIMIGDVLEETVNNWNDAMKQKQKNDISIGKMKCQPSNNSFESQQLELVFHQI